MIQRPLPRLFAWLPALGVVLLGAFVRFQNLGSITDLQFDERYYVPQAYSLGNLGYETSWSKYLPKGAGSFNPADLVHVAGTPMPTTHGPISKWLIWLGMSMFGPTDPVGWRFMSAVFGTVLIVLLIVVAWLLFRSVVWATIAGLLIAVDNQAIVMSRTAMLDIFLTTFAFAGVLFILLDRRRVSQERANLMVRPWLIAAGACFGLAAATKIVGVAFLAVFGLYVAAGTWQRMKARGEKTVRFSLLRGLLAAAWMLPSAVIAYIATWTGYLVTSGGYERGWGAGAQGLWAVVPQPLRALAHYQVVAYQMEAGLSGAFNQASPAISWIIPTRPVLLHFAATKSASGGVDAHLVTSLGDPILWWSAAAALIGVLWLALRRRRDWRAVFVVVGLAAAWGPWLAVGFRTTFHYYAIAILPFLILGLTLVLSLLWERAGLSKYRRLFIISVSFWLVIVVGVAALFLPESLGTMINLEYWRALHWLPSWR